VGGGTIPLDYKFKYSSLKKSAGIAVQWPAPLGLFRFSYAFPLDAYKGDAFRYEDEEERFQFSIGHAFQRLPEGALVAQHRGPEPSF
jgi:outer membrane protein insertion porin family